jgi:senataxin
LPAPAKDYVAVFEQLVLEEAGALVLRGVEEGEVLEPHPTIAARSHKVRRGRLVYAE